MNTLKILENETENQALWRIGNEKAAGLYGDITWVEIAEFLNISFREDETQYYDSSAYRKRYKNFADAYEQIFCETEFVETQKDELESRRREIMKERTKLQSEKLEYNKWLREEARDELISEKIIEEVKKLKPLEFPKPIERKSNSKSAVLAFGDEHYATEFKILGLYGEVINEYSPEVFESRMNDLLHRTIEIVRRENIGEIRVYALGDFVDGILRVSQLMKLRYGVVEGSVRYANFISNWLNKLTEYVKVKYQMVYGNHTELRQLGQPKGTFKEDNTGLFVREIIKARLEHNPNFEMIINPTGLIFDNVEGFNVLGIHGEVRNMESAIKDFSTTYNTPINILIGGHMHHYKSEVVGVDKEVINVPSIIGVDDYAMSLNKTSKPGAILFIIEKDYGISTEYKIKL